MHHSTKTQEDYCNSPTCACWINKINSFNWVWPINQTHFLSSQQNKTVVTQKQKSTIDLHIVVLFILNAN